ncbi:MAG TPA: fused MFS/spermidine synthase [Candidatus Polarisedimenticolia bacterium]|nr:fused MFS/spermidine synthase [Candidatus Polarisedimenticolia bacterium]
MTDRQAFRGLLVCLLLSGMSGLIYEVAWVRSLELIFGATTFAVATVLASFMGGLAAGSGVAGALAERLERHHPLRVYALFEVLIAVTALAVPLTFTLLVPLSRGLWNAFQASFAMFSLLRFLLCVAVLLVPTALMGATLPVLSRFASASDADGGGESARRVGVLFAVNTAGAVAGCAGAGLLLLPVLGLLGTQRLAVALNLLAAAGAFTIAARFPFQARARSQAAGSSTALGTAAVAAPAAAPRSGEAARRAAFLVGAYAVSGGVAMLYEVAWSRYLVLVLGSSTYSYTTMLTTFLVGLTLGAGIGTRALRSKVDAMLAIGLAQLWTATGTLIGLYVAAQLPFLYVQFYGLLQVSPRGLVGVQMLLASSVMFLPTLGLGAMFPLTIAGLAPAGERATRLVARAYAWNTLGAIAGSVAAGFWLLPGLGSRNVLVLGLVINTALAIAGFLRTSYAAVSRPRRLALLGMAALLVASVVVAGPVWRTDILSSGIYRYADRYIGLDHAAFDDRVRQSHGEFLFFDEGLTCTVGVFRTTQSLTLQVNGKPDASVPPGVPDPVATGKQAPLGDMPTQVLVAQLPLLMAKQIDDVLLIGLGSGVTLGSVLTQQVKRVDCLELENAVVRASRFFDGHSGAPLKDPRVHLIVNDARNDLLVRDRTYDVIISEPSNPWIPGAATLFTRDFFRIARSRLKPDGVLCQWIQLYELWPEDFQAILRSFQEVFPSIQIWRVGYDAVLLGAPADIPLPVSQMFARASNRVRADLSRIGVHGPEDLLARFWIGGDDLKGAVAPGPINTDDNMRIEFAAPLRMLSRDPKRLERQGAELGAMFRGRTTGALSLLRFPDADPARRALFLSRLSVATLEQGHADEATVYASEAWRLDPQPESALARSLALEAAGRSEEARAAREEGARAFPGDAEIRRLFLDAAVRSSDPRAQEREARALLGLKPDDAEARFRLAQAQEKSGDGANALRTIEPLRSRLLEAGPVAAADERLDGAALLLGRLLLGAGRAAEAIEPLTHHLARHRDDREVQALLVRAFNASGRTEEAQALERSLAPDATAQAERHLREGMAAFGSRDFAAARAALALARQYAPEDHRVSFLLARTLRAGGDRAGAITVIEQFLHLRPDTPWALGYLSQLLGENGQTELAAATAARYRAVAGGEDWAKVD